MSVLSLGIDVTAILYNRGVSRYTSNIVQALSRREDVDLRLFGSSFRAHAQLKMMMSVLAEEANIKHKPSVLAFPPSFLSRMWYGVGRLHIESLMPKVDVFHAWEELIPPSYKTPVVATVHDLALFKFPDQAHPATKEKHTQAIARLKAYQSEVIAVSEQTKRDLIELFSFEEQKIHVIPEALPIESMIPADRILPFEQLASVGITRPYLLWVGTNEPRKNIQRMIEAWRPHAKDLDFVLAGGPSIAAIPYEAGIKLVQSPNSDLLASLYTHAQALSFASLYEGFGLPILEAFWYGCPVVTANNSGMKETADDCGFLVDPYDVESISQGITEALDKGKSATRLKKMRARVESFSWDESAKQTLAVYREAKQQGHRPL